ncbi:hypothetical protein SOCE26_083230 [Sorangium cellulosum]|uniref:YdhG-like domain-containing protein n=1 Tax=Sorangium cellulosum TaxID=56 RepID=A0A2L0F5F4_SORCE|nr:DUF1801 domain-containing protein [Sorangium cellulosum]AUX46814.1 hypothetical protein SOCE26_083230 [Sorangium cellulosum]
MKQGRPRPEPKLTAKKKPPQKKKGPVEGKALAGTSREQATGDPASRLIDQRIRDLGGWRGETLARMRALILQADPEMTEEWKWKGTPVWSHHGIVCTGEAYTKVVKLTFARGASIPDPSRLFNSSLEGNTRRAIDIHEGETVDARAFKALLKAAVAQNGAPAKKAPVKAAVSQNGSPAKKAKPGASEAKPVKLLSGGNPQIAKADGDAPVQAYIAAMPGWKRDLGKRLDAIIARSAPNVRKAVKWNSPFYGIEGQGWFLSFHVLTKYVKVTFFQGMSLRPVPPGGTERSKDARWIDIYEDDQLDEAQMARWVKQAAALPGWSP